MRDAQRLAVNHKGWNVEILGSEGWIVLNDAPLTDDKAQTYMLNAKTLKPEREFRVYEAL